MTDPSLTEAVAEMIAARLEAEARAEAAEQQVRELTARIAALELERTILQDRSKAVQRGPI